MKNSNRIQLSGGAKDINVPCLYSDLDKSCQVSAWCSNRVTLVSPLSPCVGVHWCLHMLGIDFTTFPKQVHSPKAQVAGWR